MVRPASRISATLYKKKQQSLLRKIKIISAVFVLVLLGCIWGLHAQRMRVTQILVSGNIAVNTNDITLVVQRDMQKTYGWIIPTDNFFLLRRSRMNAELLAGFPILASVHISFDNFNTVHVTVSERTPVALWCAGTTVLPGQCYSVDANGFIFTQAPDLSGNDFFKLFGLITSDNPIGQSYATPDMYKTILSFLDLLKKMQFSPGPFVADDMQNYHVQLSGGATIIMSNEKTFNTDATDLQALIDSNYIKTTADFLAKLDYIDLRYDNKAIFKMK